MEANRKMLYDEFDKKYLGKAVDFDGSAGVQCVDLADRYFVDVIGLKVDSSFPWVSGARDFYNNFEKFPALVNNFNKIKNTRSLVAKKGDVVIWGGGSWGHVAIADGAGNKDWFTSIEQNTLGKHEPTQRIKHYYNNKTGVDGCAPVLGVLRPKDQKKVNGSGTNYRVTYKTGLNIRSGAGTNNKIVGVLAYQSVWTVLSRKKNGSQYWGKLADGRGWICLTGFTEKV